MPKMKNIMNEKGLTNTSKNMDKIMNLVSRIGEQTVTQTTESTNEDCQFATNSCEKTTCKETSEPRTFAKPGRMKSN